MKALSLLRVVVSGAIGAATLGGCATSGHSAGAGPPPRPGAAHLAELRRAIDSLVADPRFRSAHWGILIVDPAAGDTLYSRNAGKLFMPASNQKILTGATALARLGPDYRFRTAFAARGTVSAADSTLQGDLVVIGRGDPTMSDRMRTDAMLTLLAAADSLRAHGVRRVSGRVRDAGDAFPDSPLGYGWAWDDLEFAYAAGVDELLFNEGFSRIVVRGGARPGDAVQLSVAPATTVPRLIVTARTVAASVPLPAQGGGAPAAPEPEIAVRSDSGGRVALVSGGIAPGDSVVVTLAHRDPRGAFLSALADAFAARGIAVEGRLPRAAADTLAALDTLFLLESPPLRELLPVLEKPSQNQVAEVLFKTLGLEGTGVGSADSGRRVVESQLLVWGAARDGFVVRDGSGLSRHNYVTPETIVRVLAVMRNDPAFQVFYDALPVAGVDGTLEHRMRGTPAFGNVRAKTGYIDRARSLSGYVTTMNGTGRVLLFSFLCNNFTTTVKEVEKVQDEIAARLAAVPLAAPER